jgi:hypothetical protein
MLVKSGINIVLPTLHPYGTRIFFITFFYQQYNRCELRILWLVGLAVLVVVVLA